MLFSASAAPNGAELLLDTLLACGVDTVFGYPGGAALPSLAQLGFEDVDRHKPDPAPLFRLTKILGLQSGDTAVHVGDHVGQIEHHVVLGDHEVVHHPGIGGLHHHLPGDVARPVGLEHLDVLAEEPGGFIAEADQAADDLALVTALDLMADDGAGSGACEYVLLEAERRVPRYGGNPQATTDR